MGRSESGLNELKPDIKGMVKVYRADVVFTFTRQRQANSPGLGDQFVDRS